ncbi:MAG: response regulator [Solirubrobacteraceae bacterium]
MASLDRRVDGARTRVVAADDSYVMREALTTMLAEDREIELLQVCSDGNELRDAVELELPDVVMLDIRMPPSGTDEGIRIARELRETHREIGVVVLSQHVEPAYAMDLMADGARGRAYLLKDRIRERAELVRAVQAVASGGSAIDPLVVDALIAGRARERESPLAELTSRELEILAEIAAGKSNAAIATALVLSKRAVEKHVNSIFAKLSLSDPGSQEVSRRVRAALTFLAAEGRLSPGPAGAQETTGT